MQVTAWFHKKMNLIMSSFGSQEENDAVIDDNLREVSTLQLHGLLHWL